MSVKGTPIGFGKFKGKQKSLGYVFACGGNGNGKLGVTSTTSDTANRFIPTQVLKYSGGIGTYILGISQIDTGINYSLFLRGSDGAVFSCGANGNGQLGVTSTTTDFTNRFIPTQVLNYSGGTGTYISGISQISTGYYHSLFLRGSDGAVFSCGANGNGQLGVTSTTSDTANRFIPTQVLNYSGGTGTYISGILQISADSYQSLFLRGSDGAVFSCGTNDVGRLGVTSTTTDTANRFIPTQVLNYSGGTGTYISGILQIRTGYDISLFIKN